MDLSNARPFIVRALRPSIDGGAMLPTRKQYEDGTYDGRLKEMEEFHKRLAAENDAKANQEAELADPPAPPMACLAPASAPRVRSFRARRGDCARSLGSQSSCATRWIFLCVAVVMGCAGPAEDESFDRPVAKQGNARYRSNFYATVQHVTRRDEGKDKEEGVLTGIGYSRTGDWFRVRLETAAGGLEQDSSGLDTDTRFFDSALDWFLLPPVKTTEEEAWGARGTWTVRSHGTPRPFNVFLGGGVRLRFDDFHDDLGALTTHAGLEYSHWFSQNSRIFVAARGGYSVAPAPGPTARLDVAWEYKKLHLGAFWDWARYKKSDGFFFSAPETELSAIGVNLGLRW
jgi:hypothetical protein